MGRLTRFTCFFGLVRLERRLDLGSATRNATPHSAMHRASMGATDGQRNFARYAKNPGKTRVSELKGQEPNFWVFPQCF